MDSRLYVWKVKLSLLAAAAVLAGLHEHDRTRASHEIARAPATQPRLVACLPAVGGPGGCSTGLKKPHPAALPLAVGARPIEISASAQVDD